MDFNQSNADALTRWNRPVPAETPKEVRDSVSPAILAGLIGTGHYMMPNELLPIMDCENCVHRQEQWRDGGHCYMFREKPVGDRCGQFTKK